MPDAVVCLDDTRHSLTIREAIRQVRRRLENAGKAEAALDARLLVGLACAMPAERILADGNRILSPGEARLLDQFVARRLAGEPVSRIRGWREFWGRPFELSADTLDPRPETEQLVEGAIALLRECGESRPVVLDLGTGTGCILLSILAEVPGARGVGVDRSPGAIATASRNAARLGLHRRAAFLCANWTAAIGDELADLVVCNPPYIPRGEIAGLEPEVGNFDPSLALHGGEDGFDAFREIVTELPRVTKAGAFVLFEVGAGQAPQVERMLGEAGFLPLPSARAWQKDFAGIDRVVAVVRQ